MFPTKVRGGLRSQAERDWRLQAVSLSKLRPVNHTAARRDDCRTRGGVVDGSYIRKARCRVGSSQSLSRTLNLSTSISIVFHSAMFAARIK